MARIWCRCLATGGEQDSGEDATWRGELRGLSTAVKPPTAVGTML